MPSAFRNVILCEDIRDEAGNKKSLMGVISGDLILGDLPALIHVALFAEYERTTLKADTITIKVMQNDEEIATVGLEIPDGGSHTAAVVLPRAIVRFEQECTLSFRARFREGPEVLM